MNRQQQTMAALAAAKPVAFDPSDQVDPAARDRDLTRILAAPPAHWATAARTGPGARSRRAMAVAVAAVLAVAATAALVVPAARHTGQDQGPAATTGRQEHPPTEARGLLLAAAVRTMRQPEVTGAFWYQRERLSEVHTFGTGGKAGAGPPYTVEVSQRTASWSGRSRSRAVTTVEAPRFLTAADRAAWRAAGSPSLAPGAPPDETAGTPPRRSVNDVDQPPSFIVGGALFTIGQLRRLPADPSRLAARLRVAVQGLLDNWPTGPCSGSPGVRALVFQAAADLLNLPVIPAVRSAAFTVMAGTDGAELLGPMQDPAGRAGTGVVFPSGAEADRVLIVEEATATLLASGLVANDPAHFAVKVPAGNDHPVDHLAGDRLD